MKPFVIMLGLTCAGLAFGLYKSQTGATHELEEAVKLSQTFSNQVAELRTKLALEQATAIDTQSNLHSTLDRRVAQLAATSNRLVQVGLLLTAAQTDKAEAQTELQSKAAQCAEAKQKVAKTTSDLEFLFTENRRLQVEKNEVLGRLDDVGFLRTQLAKAEENAELQRRLAKAGQNAPVNKKAPLELQPDGSVRAVPPTV